jgi:hypothetical protein
VAYQLAAPAFPSGPARFPPPTCASALRPPSLACHPAPGCEAETRSRPPSRRPWLFVGQKEWKVREKKTGCWPLSVGGALDRSGTLSLTSHNGRTNKSLSLLVHKSFKFNTLAETRKDCGKRETGHKRAWCRLQRTRAGTDRKEQRAERGCCCSSLSALARRGSTANFVIHASAVKRRLALSLFLSTSTLKAFLQSTYLGTGSYLSVPVFSGVVARLCFRIALCGSGEDGLWLGPLVYPWL